jgi:hypothetical protein
MWWRFPTLSCCAQPLVWKFYLSHPIRDVSAAKEVVYLLLINTIKVMINSTVLLKIDDNVSVRNITFILFFNLTFYMQKFKINHPY